MAEDGTLLFKNEPYGIRIVKKDKDDDTVITGALFAILDEDDKVITVTDDVRITELNINADYRIVEVKAPEGYKLIKDAEEVGFSLDGNLVITLDDEDKAEESGIEAESHTFTVKNEKTEVKVSKVDLTGDPLTGAAFEILDDEKNVAATLDADNGYTAYGLKVSTDTEENIYTLHEKTAPLGYVVAADTQFKLDKYGETGQQQRIAERSHKADGVACEELFVVLKSQKGFGAKPVPVKKAVVGRSADRRDQHPAEEYQCRQQKNEYIPLITI